VCSLKKNKSHLLIFCKINFLMRDVIWLKLTIILRFEASLPCWQLFQLAFDTFLRVIGASCTKKHMLKIRAHFCWKQHKSFWFGQKMPQNVQIMISMSWKRVGVKQWLAFFHKKDEDMIWVLAIIEVTTTCRIVKCQILFEATTPHFEGTISDQDDS